MTETFNTEHDRYARAASAWIAQAHLALKAREQRDADRVTVKRIESMYDLRDYPGPNATIRGAQREAELVQDERYTDALARIDQHEHDLRIAEIAMDEARFTMTLADRAMQMEIARSNDVRILDRVAGIQNEHGNAGALGGRRDG